jgi:hypothetical protein
VKSVVRRISRLGRFACPRTTDCRLTIGCRLQATLDQRTCIQILREAGHLNPASATCLLDSTQISELNATDLEKHLPGHGYSAGLRYTPILCLSSPCKGDVSRWRPNGGWL